MSETLPAVPEPPTVAPAETVIGLELESPLTSSRPPTTEVAPVLKFCAASRHVPPPSLTTLIVPVPLSKIDPATTPSPAPASTRFRLLAAVVAIGPASVSCPAADSIRADDPPVTIVTWAVTVFVPERFTIDGFELFLGASVIGLAIVVLPTTSSRLVVVEGFAPELWMSIVATPSRSLRSTRSTPLPLAIT